MSEVLTILQTSQEYMARHSYDATDVYPNQASDDSEMVVQIYESYMKIDMDGSGISVLHKFAMLVTSC